MAALALMLLSEPEAEPPAAGFVGSCAERMRSWAEWQRAERDDAFACLDEPAEGAATMSGRVRLSRWAGYVVHRPAQDKRDEVAIQLQAVDSLGHRTLRTAAGDLGGYELRDGFRLVHFDEVAEVPARPAK